MLDLTAVAFKAKDADRNKFSEAGIFVTHSPTTTCFKNNYTTTTLLIMCCVSLYLTQQCLATLTATSAIATKNLNVYKQPTVPHECGSMDLRNDCNNFFRLNNCTVITGFLVIAHLPRPYAKCNFSNYQFENLREITDFLLITEVQNVTSIKNMFPNLTVIRGRRLFINYALVMTSVYDLEQLEFKSLIALQRGHVLIDANPKLCYTEKINWTRLTLRSGKNNIFLDKQAQCPQESKCNGCKRDSCWSNDVCQKIENDSVISLIQDTTECHEQCLGGCYNRTAQGCVLCKSYSDHGTCVEECPYDKYTSSHYLRCYTREECVQKKQHYIFKNTCVDFCPSDYELNNATKECDSCGGINNCPRVYQIKPAYDQTIYISDIMHAEFLKGYQIINASVVVNIHEPLDQQELVDNLSDVIEITGYLKINRSPFLTSLNFFQNLKKIHGFVLEHKLYVLIIYNNQNLSELWNVKPGFELVNGGMYIHANDKLCNRRIRQFREHTKHDNSLDSYQTSDQEVLCSPAKLNLYVQVSNHRSIKFFWPKDQTLAEVEIIYRPVNDKEQLVEKSEIDTEVCNRINWRRELKFSHELQGNFTHYIYVVENLEPHTKYAVLVKTFNGEDDTQEARSEIKYASTQFDIPTAPKISLKSKTYDTLNIEFSNDFSIQTGSQVVDFYLLEVYDMPDDKEVLDTRDYCDEPVMNFKDSGDEDYDDCCSRRQKERKDQIFLSQLRREFACSLDQTEYCQEFNDTGERKALLTKRLEAWENYYTLRSLKRFHLYVLQAKACNHAGCSSYSILSTRTNYSLAADKVYDFFACKLEDKNEYRVHFSEPKLPNGYITSYALHFRYHLFSDNNITLDHNELVCITRLEHERNNYEYVAHFKYTFNQAAIRVHSLGHHTFIEWLNITTCPNAKSVGSSAKAWYIFLASVLIASFGIVLWAFYKRRYWRKLPHLCRYLPLHSGWTILQTDSYTPEDRQILVDGFEAVRFHNSPNDDMTYLEH